MSSRSKSVTPANKQVNWQQMAQRSKSTIKPRTNLPTSYDQPRATSVGRAAPSAGLRDDIDDPDSVARAILDLREKRKSASSGGPRSSSRTKERGPSPSVYNTGRGAPSPSYAQMQHIHSQRKTPNNSASGGSGNQYYGNSSAKKPSRPFVWAKDQATITGT
mmetsp:Transcript_6130/g.13558  ORF Transcript_6130/g.13558 Transcript_6130/m.13558 type:complete len:162 (+) Transcript_6130:380-865(+)